MLTSVQGVYRKSGKVILAFYFGSFIYFRHSPNKIEDVGNASQAGAGDGLVVDEQAVGLGGGVKCHTGAGEESIQVHRDGAVDGKPHCVIAISPVFNEGDIGIRLSSGSCHEQSLS